VVTTTTAKIVVQASVEFVFKTLHRNAGVDVKDRWVTFIHIATEPFIDVLQVEVEVQDSDFRHSGSVFVDVNCVKVCLVQT
jgi:hypothetical protein